MAKREAEIGAVKDESKMIDTEPPESVVHFIDLRLNQPNFRAYSTNSSNCFLEALAVLASNDFVDEIELLETSHYDGDCFMLL